LIFRKPHPQSSCTTPCKIQDSMSMPKVFALLALVGIALGATVCPNGDKACAVAQNEFDSDELSMLAVSKSKVKKMARETPHGEAKDTGVPAVVEDPTYEPPQGLRNMWDKLSEERRNLMRAAARHDKNKARHVRDFWRSLSKEERDEVVRDMVPGEVKAASLEELRKLNVTAAPKDELALWEGGSITSDYPGVFCGNKNKRMDVAAFMQQSLDVQMCYVFTCVEPFKVTDDCNTWFYAQGTGNCKCCYKGASYYQSTASPPNNLYHCNMR